MKQRYALPLAAALIVSACADDLSQPDFQAKGRVAHAVVDNARYIVAFNHPNLHERVAALGGVVEFKHDGAGLAVVSGLSDAAAAQLARTSGVLDVMADLEIQGTTPRSIDELLGADFAPASITNPAGALRHNLQWNMRAVSAPQAWAAGKLGSEDVVVAILDSGLDYEQSDFVGKVDFATSRSFVPGDDALLPLIGIGSKHPIMDLNAHGTNVAVQAVSNGNIYAGVSSRSRLMILKVLGWNGSGATSGILQGVLHAADNGADVINMSIGYRNGVDRQGGFGHFVQFVNRAFNYAQREGVVVVVAAGNDAADMDHDGPVYRALCDAPHVVCVSATGPASATGSVDALSSYSNFGRSQISVAAPGGTNFGWVYSLCARYSLWPVPGTSQVSLGCYHPAGYYGIGFAGTSQAAPHVAGLAALLVSEMGKNSPARIKHAIESSADDLGQPGTDPQYGKGRINVARALGL
ncbi:MAG TPA: S8 family serine peptidase [Longimicrobiales bacterium]